MPEIQPKTPAPPPPPLVALVAWLIPGAGYWLIGQRLRAAVVGITILALFALGLLIAGIRVIDVPGWDDNGLKSMVRVRNSAPQWSLTARPIGEIVNKPWYVAQILAGPVTLISSKLSIDAAGSFPRTKARIGEIGTLYTAVAGMLNLMAIIDAAHRASRQEQSP